MRTTAEGQPTVMPSREQIETFLNAFFSPPNGFSLNDVETGHAAHVRPWVERLRGPAPQATILPCWRQRAVVWYIVAFSSEQAGALSDALLAFVGPTYSTFRGLGEPLNVVSPTDALVAGITAGIGRRFSDGGTKASRSALWRQLEMMREVMERRPARRTDRPRPLSRILRDFYASLAAGSQAGADVYLRQLTDRRDVDATNALFLRVQALAAFGRWQELLTLPQLGDLMDMRRPVAVTEALLCAVYHVELSSHYVQGGEAALVERFISDIRPRYQALFGQRSGIRAPEAAVMLMLQATASEEKDVVLRDAILGLPDIPEGFRVILTLLADRTGEIGSPADGDALALAHQAYQQRDFDRVLAFASRSDPSLESSRLLLEAAFQLQSLEAQDAALKKIGALSDADRKSLLALRIQRLMYEALTRAPSVLDARERGASSLIEAPNGAIAGEPELSESPTVQEVIPSDWIEWLDRLEQRGHWPRALEIARQGAREWSVEALFDRPGVAAELAEALDRSSSSPTLQLALPHLFAFWERDVEGPRRELAPVYRSMLLLLALGSQGAEEDFALAFDLIRVLLRFGPDGNGYRLIVEQVDLLLGAFPSDDRLDWALDVLDLLVANHSPDPSLQVTALMSVVALFKRRHRRVEPTQWDLLRRLAEDLGQAEALEGVLREVGVDASKDDVPEAAVLLESLRTQVVAVYSLTESAARRAKDFILLRAPEVTVELSSEKVGTDSLRHLARNAHIFIVVTGSATHAATEFIDQHRPKGDPSRVTLRPRGRGAASILRALFEHLSRVAENEAQLAAS